MRIANHRSFRIGIEMSAGRQRTDKRFIQDLFKASQPRANEHRLAFTLNFTSNE